MARNTRIIPPVPTLNAGLWKNGMFTMSTEPYQKCSSSQPLITGTMKMVDPALAAQLEIALGRSCGGKTLTRIDNVDGMTNAAAAPMRARQAMSCQVVLDAVAN